MRSSGKCACKQVITLFKLHYKYRCLIKVYFSMEILYMLPVLTMALLYEIDIDLYHLTVEFSILIGQVLINF